MQLIIITSIQQVYQYVIQMMYLLINKLILIIWLYQLMNNILLYLIYDLLKIYYLGLMIMGIEGHVIRVMGDMVKTYCFIIVLLYIDYIIL
jgi:hypothetical protein